MRERKPRKFVVVERNDNPVSRSKIYRLFDDEASAKNFKKEMEQKGIELKVIEP